MNEELRELLEAVVRELETENEDFKTLWKGQMKLIDRLGKSPDES